MEHINVERAATHAFVGSVDELGRRLSPSYPINYCEACDVPNLAPPESFFAKIAEAKTALQADEYITASQKAAEAVEILRDLLSADVTGAQKIELLLQRLLLPALIDLLPDGGVMQSIVLGLMMLDRRIAEWYPDAFAGNRLKTLFWEVVNRWRDESEGGGFGESWPFYVVDTSGLAVTVLASVQKLGSERLQVWCGYGWDAPDGFGETNARTAAERTFSMWVELHDDLPVAPESYAEAPPELLDFSIGITLVPLSRALGGPSIVPHLTGDLTRDFKLAGDWTMSVSGGGGAPAGVAGFGAAAAGLGGLLNLKLAYGGKKPAVSWGDGDTPEKGRAMIIEKISVEGAVIGDVEGLDPDKNDARALIRVEKGKVVFGAPGSAFLNRLLPNGIEGTFNAAFGGSVRDGFYWEGGLGTEVFTAVDWKTPKVAGIQLEVPHLRMKLKFEKKEPEEGEEEKGASLSLEAGLGLRLNLGPVKFGVGDLGGKVALTHAVNTDGNVGPFDFSWEIMDPKSVEFVVDTSGVRGEGFLARDPDLDRWTGVWRLKLGRFQLDGVVISEQDSVLGIAWMTNLGIPFPGGSLDGAGVLVGNNRRGDPEAFLAGIKTGAMGAVLFPEDPVGEAPQIIASLTQFFPREEDHLVAGLMLQWHFGGEVRVITAELGVILEWGPDGLSDAYILGQGDMRLEHLPESVYRVHVELFGHYDIEASSFLLRVELRDSRIASGELTGGGLFFYDDSDDESFIASLGGFNPRYSAPPRFAGVPRISAHMSDSPKFKLYFELYIAATSSSFHLGGKLALYAEIKGFVVEGYLALDVLFRSDGEFFLDVAFYIGLKRGGKTLASLEVAGTLAGMSTWSLTGRATLKILFFKVSVPIEWTSKGGGEPDPAQVDAQAALVAALKAPVSWVQDRRGGAIALLDAEREGVWIRPEQGVEVRQDVLPLGETITRLGGSPLLRARRFEVAGLRFAGKAVPSRGTTGRFNLALYRDVDLEEAVRAPFVEETPAGVAVDLGTVALGEDVAGLVEHEEIVVDDRFVPAAARATAFATRSSLPENLAEPPAIQSEEAYYAAPRNLFQAAPPRFVVTDTSLRVRYGDAGVGVAFTDARDRVQEARDQKVRRYVVRRHEIAA
jgi:hypothetical protein